MYQSPGLLQALGRDRVAELRRHAPHSERNRCEPRRRQFIEAARSTTGWLLVDVGLRLAAPRNAMNHPVARGPQ